jgi:hypothetical protein
MGIDSNTRELQVLDNSNTKGPDGKSIQWRTMDEFLGRQILDFDIISSPCAEGEDSIAFGETTMEFARQLQALEYCDLHKYNVLCNNCETFALICTTRSLCVESKQVIKFFEACEDDMRRGRESFILQSAAVATGAAKSSCNIM